MKKYLLNGTFTGLVQASKTLTCIVHPNVKNHLHVVVGDDFVIFLVASASAIVVAFLVLLSVVVVGSGCLLELRLCKGTIVVDAARLWTPNGGNRLVLPQSFATDCGAFEYPIAILSLVVCISKQRIVGTIRRLKFETNQTSNQIAFLSFHGVLAVEQ